MKTTKTAKGFEIFVYLWRHKILLAVITFVIYLGFFDKYNFSTQYKLQKSVRKLEREKAKYLELTEDAKKDKLDIEKNFEKFARERYMMSRQDEDVFVIEKQKKN